MHFDFSSDLPPAEQKARAAAMRKPGRKHLKQPGIRAKERVRATARRGALVTLRIRQTYCAQVAAYWRGDLDEFPPPPQQR